MENTGGQAPTQNQVQSTQQDLSQTGGRKMPSADTLNPSTQYQTEPLFPTGTEGSQLEQMHPPSQVESSRPASQLPPVNYQPPVQSSSLDQIQSEIQNIGGILSAQVSTEELKRMNKIISQQKSTEEIKAMRSRLETLERQLMTSSWEETKGSDRDRYVSREQLKREEAVADSLRNSLGLPPYHIPQFNPVSNIPHNQGLPSGYPTLADPLTAQQAGTNTTTYLFFAILFALFANFVRNNVVVSLRNSEDRREAKEGIDDGLLNDKLRRLERGGDDGFSFDHVADQFRHTAAQVQERAFEYFQGFNYHDPASQAGRHGQYGQYGQNLFRRDQPRHEDMVGQELRERKRVHDPILNNHDEDDSFDNQINTTQSSTPHYNKSESTNIQIEEPKRKQRIAANTKSSKGKKGQKEEAGDDDTYDKV